MSKNIQAIISQSRAFTKIKASKSKNQPKTLQDGHRVSEGLKIHDYNAPEGGKSAQWWSDKKTELERYTKAIFFDKDVQTDPKAFCQYFGFKGIEFGNWTEQDRRLEFLFGAAHAFEVVRKHFMIPPEMIGFNGVLSIAFGARGFGGAAAHYEPFTKTINITKPHDIYGSLFHEWIHAVDNQVGMLNGWGHSGMISATKLNRSTTEKRLDIDKIEAGGITSLAEKVYDIIYYNGTAGKANEEKTPFCIAMTKTDSDYYPQRVEVLARIYEVFMSVLASRLQVKNSMLVKNKYEAQHYPPTNQITSNFDFFNEYLKTCLKCIEAQSVKIAIDIEKLWHPVSQKVDVAEIVDLPKEEKKAAEKVNPPKPTKKPKLSEEEKKRKLKEDFGVEIEEYEINHKQKLTKEDAERLIKIPGYSYVQNEHNREMIAQAVKDMLDRVRAKVKEEKNQEKQDREDEALRLLKKELEEAEAEEEKEKRKPKKELKKVEKIGNIYIGKAVKIATQSEVIEGHYGLMSITKIIPSNDPFTFKPNPDYPASCQTRDYSKVESEQLKVKRFASDFDPSHLVNNSPDATTGSPIVTKDGYVLGGNGRTMVLKNLNKYKWQDYEKYLEENISIFGFDKNIFRTTNDRLVLVRVIDVDLQKCSYYSDRLNSSTKQEFDETQEGISIAKSLSENAFLKIAEAFEAAESDTFAGALAESRTQKAIIEVLRNEKIINANNMSQWLKDNDFTAKGRAIIENVLIGYILPDKSLIEKAKIYTNKLIKVLPTLIKIKQLPKEWSLINEVQEVIKIENKRRSSGQNKSDFLKQDDMFSSGKKEVVAPKVKALWHIMDLGVTSFKNALASYLRTAKNETDDSNMFGGGEKVEALDVLENLTKVKNLQDKKGKGGKAQFIAEFGKSNEAVEKVIWTDNKVEKVAKADNRNIFHLLREFVSRNYTMFGKTNDYAIFFDKLKNALVLERSIKRAKNLVKVKKIADSKGKLYYNHNKFAAGLTLADKQFTSLDDFMNYCSEPETKSLQDNSKKKKSFGSKLLNFLRKW